MSTEVFDAYRAISFSLKHKSINDIVSDYCIERTKSAPQKREDGKFFVRFSNEHDEPCYGDVLVDEKEGFVYLFSNPKNDIEAKDRLSRDFYDYFRLERDLFLTKYD